MQRVAWGTVDGRNPAPHKIFTISTGAGFPSSTVCWLFHCHSCAGDQLQFECKINPQMFTWPVHGTWSAVTNALPELPENPVKKLLRSSAQETYSEPWASWRRSQSVMYFRFFSRLKTNQNEKSPFWKSRETQWNGLFYLHLLWRSSKWR